MKIILKLRALNRSFDSFITYLNSQTGRLEADSNFSRVEFAVLSRRLSISFEGKVNFRIFRFSSGLESGSARETENSLAKLLSVLVNVHLEHVTPMKWKAERVLFLMKNECSGKEKHAVAVRCAERESFRTASFELKATRRRNRR